MKTILNFIISQISDRVKSWSTTIPAGLLAYITNAASAYIDPAYLHSFSGQVAQWALYGLSLILLAWKDRKQPPVDYSPTQPPKGDQ